MFNGKLTTQQLGIALASILEAYEVAGKKPPSLHKLVDLLKLSPERTLDDFSSLLAKTGPKKRTPPASKAAPTIATDRVEYFKKRLDLALEDPSTLDQTVDEMRIESKARKSGTLTKPALEILYAELVGAPGKFSTIDNACDGIRQRMIETINDRKSLAHSRSHRAY